MSAFNIRSLPAKPILDGKVSKDTLYVKQVTKTEEVKGKELNVFTSPMSPVSRLRVLWDETVSLLQ